MLLVSSYIALNSQMCFSVLFYKFRIINITTSGLWELNYTHPSTIHTHTHRVKVGCSMNWPIPSYPILAVLSPRSYLWSHVHTKTQSLSLNMLFHLPDLPLNLPLDHDLLSSSGSSCASSLLSLTVLSRLNEVVLSLLCINYYSSDICLLRHLQQNSDTIWLHSAFSIRLVSLWRQRFFFVYSS